ncbi:MAG: hypothetical protein B7X03_02635 [Parcubacteria group bacterium 21-58-10]|nr:MAG: hypothetical protein B7X03_02635 [Parcubacteria group bacterium 21-58-10]
MQAACSGTQASDRFGITLDFVTKLHNGSISEEEAKRFLRREDPFVQPKVSARSAGVATPFPVIATTMLSLVTGKPTKKCFPRSRYAYRGGEIDDWLPKEQPETLVCVITTFAPPLKATFVEWAAAILSVPVNTPTRALGSLLVERGHTMTLVQAEDMMEQTKKGGLTGVRTDGWDNFFFVETGNEDDPVSVARISFSKSRWEAGVLRFNSSFEWAAGHSLLVRSSDASKL